MADPVPPDPAPRDPARKVARLPERGTLIVATDLHGNLRDYVRLRALYDREAARGNDPFLLLCGDLVHGPSPDLNQPGAWPEHLGTCYRDESLELVRDYITFALREQTLCLMGNHEHAHVGGPVLGKFYPDEAAALESEMTRAEVAAVRALFVRFPLLALAPNGVAFTHACPSLTEPDLDAFEELTWAGYEDVPIHAMPTRDALGALLWSRYAEAGAARRFLEAVSTEAQPMNLVVYGHDVVHSGYEKVGREQICVSTSYGLLDERKVYLRLDLGRRYRSVDDLREGFEILRLHG